MEMEMEMKKKKPRLGRYPMGPTTRHRNEVLQVCQMDPKYCDIFGPASECDISRFNSYIHKRVPALVFKEINAGGGGSWSPFYKTIYHKSPVMLKRLLLSVD